MSRAFTRDGDENRPPPPPELKISPHRNLVTARGLALIEAKLGALEDELAARPDEARREILQRDRRYWAARRASAEVTPPPADPHEIAFASTVTIRRGAGDPETVTIVGEDEADPAAGLLSHVSPLAMALCGGRAGEVVTMGERKPPLEIEILAVRNDQPGADQ